MTAILKHGLPTLQARDGDGRGAQAKRYLDPKRNYDLPDAIAYFCGPMPTLTGHGNNNRVGASAKSGNGLATALRAMPTLCAADGDKGGRGDLYAWFNNSGRQKGVAMRVMPTLAARDWRGPNRLPFRERGGGTRGEQLPNFLGGPLNPDWCEWWMGFPVGWSDPGVPNEALVFYPFTQLPPIPPTAYKVKCGRHRIRCMGLSVVPAVVAEIAKAIEASRTQGGGS